MFQINEPLIINGVDSGNNIVSANDNSFEDVKAVGSSAFTANTVLDTKKKVFNEGVEFNVSGGNTLASSAIADFRSQLKIGDIITYTNAATAGDPIFNTVTAVTKDSVTIATNQTITGVCNGTVVNSTPTGVDVLIPTLKESDDPGFRVKLADKYIASMNVLDSSYITRKQFTETASGNSVTFNISSLGGDTSNLFFEPFSVLNYVLEVGDVVEKLLAPMVTVNASLKTLQLLDYHKQVVLLH